ncbi:MAG: tRNA uridine-5-carboxymethylaminomethyl(34) synthesis GTPase MnmE [Caulobacteraceae bacterium]
MRDGVFALATAPGRAAIAVMRMSGSGVAAVVEQLTGRLPQPRRASTRRLRDPSTGEVVDEALVLWLPAPGSFTGEDSAELHLHGGMAVVARITELLQQLGLRLAEPGEFTRRAFENDRLDLAQAEAVADLVDAETEAQRRQALAQLRGDLSRRHEAWRAGLLDALAMLEAAIDFPDEDLPDALVAEARGRLGRVAAEVTEASRDTRGERVREGYRIALIGAPNAGKSSLLNALAGRDVAIVTEVAGTTRDVLETPFLLGGYSVVLADMAGLRATEDRVEAEGVRRANAWATGADLRLLVVDGSASESSWVDPATLLTRGDLVVLNKSDRAPGNDLEAAKAWATSHSTEVLDLAATESVEGLRAWLVRKTTQAMSGAEVPAATRLRHREALVTASGFLDRALYGEGDPELVAENIRLAARSLERIAGRLDPESVLDRVFSTFCIGK